MHYGTGFPVACIIWRSTDFSKRIPKRKNPNRKMLLLQRVKISLSCNTSAASHKDQSGSEG